jgi:hypothetical protein
LRRVSAGSRTAINASGMKIVLGKFTLLTKQTARQAPSLRIIYVKLSLREAVGRPLA